MAVKNITLKLDAEQERKNLSLNKETCVKWEEFTQGSTQKQLFLTAALEDFMERYGKGEVKITVEL